MNIHYYALADIYVTGNIWVHAGVPVGVEESPLQGFVTVVVKCNGKDIRVATPAEKIIAIEGTLNCE